MRMDFFKIAVFQFAPRRWLVMVCPFLAGKGWLRADSKIAFQAGLAA